ncbi:MAG TPA: anthranilate synthase component I [Syntrophales bacterium]|nr:anthranilate synthase component I [Syntrophales bacterium]
MHYPEFEKFKELTEQGNLIPVYREILADIDTPVSALMKLRTRSHVFLLESVEGGEKWGRFTFLGSDPRIIFKVRGDNITISKNGTSVSYAHGGKPLQYLKDLLRIYRPVSIDGLPRFYGGAVGFLGYDMVRYFERLPSSAVDDLMTDDSVFLITDTLIIFDNVRHTIKVVSCAAINGTRSLKDIYDETIRKIDRLVEILKAPPDPSSRYGEAKNESPLGSNMSREEFKIIVEKAKDYIVAGDIIQVVLSQRFHTKNGIDPVDLYRALRYVNPSPYLFFLKLDDAYLIGSSPEVMVRLEEGAAELRPIAGTRRRGRSEQEDRNLAHELLEDPKERAEHVMLVDLGRNDLGRIAETGTVQVNQLMAVERYSHVMHLVSNIQAQLAPGKDCFDVLAAAFPAGTLSGAPKIRAMEIIDELEPTRRGTYGGAVGYFSYTGNMDLCITIRTMLIKNGMIFVQVGAGIVADSDPEKEYQETLSKGEGMMKAINLASSGFELRNNHGGNRK